MRIKLNLIPTARKEEIKKALQLRAVWKWETELVAIVLMFAAILASMSYIMKMNLSVAEASLSTLMSNDEQYKEIEKYDSAIKDMNDLTGKLGKIQSSQLYWSKFMVKFNDKVPLGVEIDTISTANYAISLVGQADTRDHLLVFRDNISNDGCFTNVNLPLSDLVSRDNLDFQMSFSIKKECLQ